MALYFLENDWFAPDGRWYKAARVQPVEIPDELAKSLPKSAKRYDGTPREQRATPVPMMNIPVRGFRTVTNDDLLAKQAAEPAPEPEKPAEIVVAEAEAAAVGDAERKAEKAPTRQRRG